MQHACAQLGKEGRPVGCPADGQAVLRRHAERCTQLHALTFVIGDRVRMRHADIRTPLNLNGTVTRVFSATRGTIAVQLDAAPDQCLLHGSIIEGITASVAEAVGCRLPRC